MEPQPQATPTPQESDIQLVYPKVNFDESPKNIIRPIRIEQLNHGYIVSVGCESFAIEKSSDLIDKLTKYIKNPLEVEIKYRQKKIF